MTNNKKIKLKRVSKWIIAICTILLGLIFVSADDLFVGIAGIALGIAIVTGVFVLLSRSDRKELGDSGLPQLTAEKEDHYYQLGMDKEEVVFFRKTMADAKNQIVKLEHNMKATSKLKSIDLRLQTVTAAKAMFKELVQDPKKLHLADQFLYSHLPNITDLSTKYLEINQHDIKSKQTYQALEQCALAIEKVSNLLVNDYNKFVQEDLEDLEVEISLAEQNARLQKSSQPKGEE